MFVKIIAYLTKDIWMGSFFTEIDLCMPTTIQKQPPEVFCKKRCSYKFRKIDRKTPVSESLFNKDVDLTPAT